MPFDSAPEVPAGDDGLLETRESRAVGDMLGVLESGGWCKFKVIDAHGRHCLMGAFHEVFRREVDSRLDFMPADRMPRMTDFNMVLAAMEDEAEKDHPDWNGCHGSAGTTIARLNDGARDFGEIKSYLAAVRRRLMVLGKNTVAARRVPLDTLFAVLP